MDLNNEERSRREPFWQVNNPEEAIVITNVLRRRFPVVYSILEESLESADPLDIVYPGNPREYSDVTEEIIVLLAPFDVDLKRLSKAQLEQVVHSGLAKRFGEEPNESRVQKAVQLINQRATSYTDIE